MTNFSVFPATTKMKYKRPWLLVLTMFLLSLCCLQHPPGCGASWMGVASPRCWHPALCPCLPLGGLDDSHQPALKALVSLVLLASGRGGEANAAARRRLTGSWWLLSFRCCCHRPVCAMVVIKACATCTTIRRAHGHCGFDCRFAIGAGCAKGCSCASSGAAGTGIATRR